MHRKTAHGQAAALLLIAILHCAPRPTFLSCMANQSVTHGLMPVLSSGTEFPLGEYRYDHESNKVKVEPKSGESGVGNQRHSLVLESGEMGVGKQRHGVVLESGEMGVGKQRHGVVLESDELGVGKQRHAVILEHTANRNQTRKRSFRTHHNALNGETPSDTQANRNLRENVQEASALQLGGEFLRGIGGALLGSAASTALGGVQQSLQGPFALTTPPSAMPGALNTGQMFAAPAPPGAPMAPVAVYPTYAPNSAVDTSHNVTAIAIGTIVGLIALCLIGGCIYKMTKRKKR